MSEEATLDEYTDSFPAEGSEQRESRFWGTIPEGWELIDGTDVYDVNPNPKSNEEPNTYIEMDALDTELPWPRYFGERNASEYSGKTFTAGDTLFARITPCTENGKAALVSEMDTRVGIGSTEYAVLSPNTERINPWYLYYVGKSHPVHDYAVSRMRGSTGRQRVPFSVFRRELDVGLPPLGEQRRIATVLQNVDQSIRKTEEIISQVETVRTGFVRGLYDSDQFAERDGRSSSEEQRFESILESRREVWAEAEEERQRRRGDFDGSIDESSYSPPLNVATQRLPELPEGWLWTSLDTFVAYDIDYRGRTPPYSDSGISVISSGNIQDGEIVFEDEKYVSEETYNEWLDRGVPREGDLLITTEAPVGKVTLYPEGTYLPTRRIITFRTVGVENRYLQAAICHPYVQNYLTAQSGGSTVGRILKDHLLKTPIPLPTKEEQTQIADTFKDFDQRIANESEYKSRLQRLKQGLMQDLLSGTVRTTDTNIEVPEEIARHG